MKSHEFPQWPSSRLVPLAILLLLATYIQPTFAEEDCSAISASILGEMKDTSHDYDTFSSLPLSHRRVLYHSLTPDEQRNLWAEHISNYVTNRTELSVEQLNLLESIVVLLGKGVALNGNDDMGQADSTDLLDSLESRAEKLWDKGDLTAIFAVLGTTPADPKGTFNSRGFLCECSVQSDWCLIQGSDCQYSSWCTYHPIGCGFLWNHPCDGLCFT